MAVNSGIVPQEHQQRLLDEAAESSSTPGASFKKLLVHGLGSGKSFSALGSADALKQPFLSVTPASLRNNMRGEVGKFLDNPPDNRVISYTSLASAAPDKYSAPTVIFDEAQRLTSPNSAQAEAAKILASKAKNVILLSGTPIRNRPDELAPLLEILTGNRMTADEFNSRYVGQRRIYPGGLLGRLTGAKPITEPFVDNREELTNLLKGKVDYYKPSKAPVDVDVHDIDTDMTSQQAMIYKAMYDKLPWLMRYKMRWDYPLTDQELAQSRSFMTGPRQVALSTFPFMKSKDPLKAFKESGKLQTAFTNLKKVVDDPRQKAIVYSNFVSAGLKPYAAALTHSGIPNALFHGGMSDAERKKAVADFNDGKIRVVLVGPSGSEGVSFKGAQLTQILDPHWNSARTDQASARGLRFDSHVGLPEDLKSMRIERYSSTLPKDVLARTLGMFGMDDPARRKTVDATLNRMSSEKDRANSVFNDLLKEIGTANRKVAEVLASVADALAVKPGKPAVSPLSRLMEAKRRSDVRDYDGKTSIVRELIKEYPRAWEVDTPPQNGILGLTHTPTGFRLHMPAKAVHDLLVIPPSQAVPVKVR